MVGKDGYFSITDACIKHRPDNFLILRNPPPRIFFSTPFPWDVSKWEKKVGTAWGHPLGSKSHPGPEKPLEGRRSGVKGAQGLADCRWGGRVRPAHDQNSEGRGQAHRVQSHRKLCSESPSKTWFPHGGEGGVWLPSLSFIPGPLFSWTSPVLSVTRMAEAADSAKRSLLTSRF